MKGQTFTGKVCKEKHFSIKSQKQNESWSSFVRQILLLSQVVVGIYFRYQTYFKYQFPPLF